MNWMYRFITVWNRAGDKISMNGIFRNQENYLKGNSYLGIRNLVHCHLIAESAKHLATSNKNCQLEQFLKMYIRRYCKTQQEQQVYNLPSNIVQKIAA